MESFMPFNLYNFSSSVKFHFLRYIYHHTNEAAVKHVESFFQKLLNDVNESGYKEVLVLTHGGLIYKMNHHLYKLGVIEGLPKPDAAKACPPNTGVSKFQMKISPEGQLTWGKCQIFMSGDHLDQ